jgi:4-amino-4-deoxy-L-arabinose transferase-like glycosyltransferase
VAARARLGIGALFTGVLVLLLANLGGSLLWEPDEGRHALIARGILNAATWRDVLLPHLGGRPYYDKPILFYWLEALVFRAAGISTVSARLVSVAAGFTVLVAVWRWTRATWGVACAAWAVVILATAGEFIALARFVNLDMLLTCWMTLGILAGARWLEDPEGRSAWPIGVYAGLGLLTKGLIAPVMIGLVLGGTALASGLGRRMRWRPLVAAGVVALVVAGPWYLAVLRLDPEYLRQFLLEHHLHRFLDAPDRMHPKPFWFSSAMALLGFLPWTLLLPAVIANLATNRRWDLGTRLCVVWAAAVVSFFSMSSGQLGTYVLPALAPLAMLTARLLSAAPESSGGRIVSAPLAVGAVFVIVAPAALWWLPQGAPFVGVAALVGLMLGGLFAWGAAHGTVAHGGRALAAVGVVFALAYFGAIAPRVSRFMSDESLDLAIAACDPAGRMPFVSMYLNSSSAYMGIDRPIRHVEQMRRLRRISQRRNSLLVLSPQRDSERVAARSVVVRRHDAAAGRLAGAASRRLCGLIRARTDKRRRGSRPRRRRTRRSCSST